MMEKNCIFAAQFCLHQSIADWQFDLFLHRGRVAMDHALSFCAKPAKNLPKTSRFSGSESKKNYEILQLTYL